MMLKSSLLTKVVGNTCEGDITVFERGTSSTAIATDRTNEQAIFKNCAPFAEYMCEKNNIHNHSQNI